MKIKLIIKGIGLTTLMALLFLLSSCSKKTDDNLTDQKEQQKLLDKNFESSSVDEKDFEESYEDLTTVNYKEFYDQLSPHGEWIEVSAEEIGLQAKTTASKETSNNSSPLIDLPWIEDAVASTENIPMVYVWKPSTNLAVTSTAGTVPVYAPYSNGQWVNTDAGWYFKAATPVEETVSHYGRWINSPTAGWLWVPGRVWAPAWVDWKQNDEYISWAPLPPSANLINGTVSVPVINDNEYVIVQKKYFLEPDLYKNKSPNYDNGNNVLISDMKHVEGIMIVDKSIINKGPDVNALQNMYGKNIELIKINPVGNFEDIKYSDKEFSVYKPNFKRYKNKGNAKLTLNEPKSFKKYDEWKVKKAEEKELNKESKNDEKEIKKESNRDDNRNKDNTPNDNNRKNNDKNDIDKKNEKDNKKSSK